MNDILGWLVMFALGVFIFNRVPFSIGIPGVLFLIVGWFQRYW